MTHNHHSHEPATATTSLNRAFTLGIVLNLVFVAIEFATGFFTRSMGLLSDAGHNLSDVAGLVLAMLAFRLARIRSNSKYTYGYKKSTVLVSLLNAVILLVATGVIIAESIDKLLRPQPVAGGIIIWTAGVGVIINAFTAWLFVKDKEKDLNVKGAYLHMAADALVSIGVALSGVLILCTGWYMADPITGLLIAGVIIYATWNLLHDSIRLSLDGVPSGISRNGIEKMIRSVDGVTDIHHLHIWAISTTETALTAHIVIPDAAQMEPLKRRLKHLLLDKAIAHVTLEFETDEADCADRCL